MYFKHSFKQAGTKMPQNLDNGESEDEDALETLYIKHNFGTGKNDQDHAMNLLNRFNQDQGEDNVDGEDEKDVDALEAMLKDQDDTAGVTDTYKLFNLICKENPHQILRYLQPALYRNHPIQPLWASDKGILNNKDVPKCPHCGGQRQFEMQIMPQIFDKIAELALVDWETIVIYTCSNPRCRPDFSKDESYTQEFSYV